MKLKGSAGYYQAEIQGRKVEVEYTTYSAYGDKGWMAYVDLEPVTEYPRTTRGEALRVAEATIRSQEIAR
jgi:hypothetical protein